MWDYYHLQYQTTCWSLTYEFLCLYTHGLDALYLGPIKCLVVVTCTKKETKQEE